MSSKASVWLIYDPEPDCLCWRDALCRHGLTWEPEEGSRHLESFGGAYESAADAIRETYGWRGFEVVGQLIRQRYSEGSSFPHTTRRIFVMPKDGGRLTDDHDASEDPSPLWIIERESITPRSHPGDDIREYADNYRSQSG